MSTKSTRARKAPSAEALKIAHRVNRLPGTVQREIARIAEQGAPTRLSSLPEDLAEHLSMLQARASELQELLWHLARHEERLAGILTLAARTASDVNDGLDERALDCLLAGSERAAA